MKLKSFVYLLLSFFFSDFYYSQIQIKETEFYPKNILTKIFQGEYLVEKNVQKWPVSQVQALELNSYIDSNNFSYTAIDTIFNLKVDTSNYKIVLFKTLPVDSSGWIQDYMASQILIGIAYFEQRKSNFHLTKFNLSVANSNQSEFINLRIEEIGAYKFALVLREETVQDWGTESWFELFNDRLPLFLKFDYLAYIPSEKSCILENSIEVIKTENEYYDFNIHSKIIPTEIIDTERALKIKPIKTVISPSLNEKVLRVQIPYGYSIQP
jgi:hypothetical protein